MTTLLLAWILWAQPAIAKDGTVVPMHPVDGFDTKAECSQAAADLFKTAHRDYVCFPDTFDPRPKLACENEKGVR